MISFQQPVLLSSFFCHIACFLLYLFLKLCLKCFYFLPETFLFFFNSSSIENYREHFFIISFYFPLSLLFCHFLFILTTAVEFSNYINNTVEQFVPVIKEIKWYVVGYANCRENTQINCNIQLQAIFRTKIKHMNEKISNCTNYRSDFL